MMEQLAVMQHNMDRARKADLKISIHKMEVRLAFVFVALVTHPGKLYRQFVNITFFSQLFNYSVVTVIVSK